jgi:soluble lytic murein transglycosylase
MTFNLKNSLGYMRNLFVRAALPLVVLSLCSSPALVGEAELMADADEWNYVVSQRDTERVLGVLRAYKTGLDDRSQERLAKIIADNSRSYALDLNLVLAIIKTESNFNAQAVSRKGAIGLMQINPATGQKLARDLGVEWKGEETLRNPFVNARMGIHYFNALLDRYRHDIESAVAAYNFGPSGRVRRMRSGPGVRPEFVDRVYANYDGFKKVYSL